MLSEAMGQERDQEEEQAGGETATVWPEPPSPSCPTGAYQGAPRQGPPQPLAKLGQLRKIRAPGVAWPHGLWFGPLRDAPEAVWTPSPFTGSAPKAGGPAWRPTCLFSEPRPSNTCLAPIRNHEQTASGKTSHKHRFLQNPGNNQGDVTQRHGQADVGSRGAGRRALNGMSPPGWELPPLWPDSSTAAWKQSQGLRGRDLFPLLLVGSVYSPSWPTGHPWPLWPAGRGLGAGHCAQTLLGQQDRAAGRTRAPWGFGGSAFFQAICPSSWPRRELPPPGVRGGSPVLCASPHHLVGVTWGDSWEAGPHGNLPPLKQYK